MQTKATRFSKKCLITSNKRLQRKDRAKLKSNVLKQPARFHQIPVTIKKMKHGRERLIFPPDASNRITQWLTDSEIRRKHRKMAHRSDKDDRPGSPTDDGRATFTSFDTPQPHSTARSDVLKATLGASQTPLTNTAQYLPSMMQNTPSQVAAGEQTVPDTVRRRIKTRMAQRTQAKPPRRRLMYHEDDSRRPGRLIRKDKEGKQKSDK